MKMKHIAAIVLPIAMPISEEWFCLVLTIGGLLQEGNSSGPTAFSPIMCVYVCVHDHER